MAARKTKHLSLAWREKIRTSMLLNRLQNHIAATPDSKDLSKKLMDKSQVSAALGLLKKTLPDLSAHQHSGPEGGPVEHKVTIVPI